MTSSMIVAMLRQSVSLAEALKTVIGTLPICQVRKVAYATFTVVEIDRRQDAFKVSNFDNPPVLYFRRGRHTELPTRRETVLERAIAISEGQLRRGDFLAVVSDGVLHAGVGGTLNFGWGEPQVARFVEDVFRRQPDTARNLVRAVIGQTSSLYGGRPGDDATLVGIYVREKHSIMVFTGPPLDSSRDGEYVERLLAFPGRKVVCGGTTGTIVSRYLGQPIEPDISTMRDDVPPIGLLSGIDLVTEGILTVSRALDLIDSSAGDPGRLPADRNGAVLLARELLEADAIHFVVGQTINEYYQNPLLPKNVSIRRNLVETLIDRLIALNKEVGVEYC
jgi:hypothetical protein